MRTDSGGCFNLLCRPKQQEALVSMVVVCVCACVISRVLAAHLAVFFQTSLVGSPT